MDISVIVCTYNRFRLLANALESVAKSEVPDGILWEILVIDNNCTDGTPAVVERFCNAYPTRFRYKFEPQPGKSYALNTGIREARGSVIAFMDDDVTVEANWLWSLTQRVLKGAYSGAGGRILADRDFSAPNWLSIDEPFDLRGILALFDLGDEPRDLDRPPIGTNMAYRKSVFEAYGGFRVELGPRPGSEIRSEDFEFGRRVLGEGVKIRYEPAAIVYHRIPDERLNQHYFLRFFFDLGRADTIEFSARRPDILGIPRPVLTFLKTTLYLLPKRTLDWQCTFEPRRRFYRKCWVWRTFGEIGELLRNVGRRFWAVENPKSVNV